jgi:polyisoprenyl-phosphate glycosyltransferase
LGFAFKKMTLIYSLFHFYFLKTDYRMSVENRNEKLFSVLIPAFNSEKKLLNACECITKRLEAEQIPFELLIIDDGSKDNTWQLAKTIAATDTRVRPFRLSRNYTSPYVHFAAFSVCKGACIMFMPDDLQRPVDTLIECYRKWELGHKIVISYRNSRDDGWFTDFCARLYYRVMNRLSDISLPINGADGFLADREIIDILNTRIRPIHTSSMVEVLRLGFDPIYVPHERKRATGKSRWTWRKKVNLAKDNFFASSSFPIRFISNLGLTISLICLISIPFLVYARYFTHSILFGFRVPGWTTIVTLAILLNGIMLFSLGIVAEYIWRIYEEVKGRPGFIIRQDEI